MLNRRNKVSIGFNRMLCECVGFERKPVLMSHNAQKINAVCVGFSRGKLRLIFMLGECVGIERSQF